MLRVSGSFGLTKGLRVRFKGNSDFRVSILAQLPSDVAPGNACGRRAPAKQTKTISTCVHIYIYIFIYTYTTYIYIYVQI